MADRDQWVSDPDAMPRPATALLDDSWVKARAHAIDPTRAGTPDPGAMICACFNVGVTTITRAITEQGLLTVEALGAALSAGTNCGSCRPEIRALIARHLPRELEAAE